MGLALDLDLGFCRVLAAGRAGLRVSLALLVLARGADLAAPRGRAALLFVPGFTFGRALAPDFADACAAFAAGAAPAGALFAPPGLAVREAEPGRGAAGAALPAAPGAAAALAGALDRLLRVFTGGGSM